MEIPYTRSIREGNWMPYLGTVEGTVMVLDFAEADPSARRIAFESNVKNPRALERLRDVEFVQAYGPPSSELVEALASLPKLETLFISGRRAPEMPPLRVLRSLRYLILFRASRLTSLDLVRGMSRLRSLFVSELPRLEDLSALETTSGLEELCVEGDIHGKTSQITDLSPIERLPRLELLALRTKGARLEPRHLAPLSALSQISLTTRRYPTEELLAIDAALAPGVVRNWELTHQDPERVCSRCGELGFVVLAGARQQPFCGLCRGDKLKDFIAAHVGTHGAPPPLTPPLSA